MLKKYIQLTYEISLLFVIGTFISILIKTYLSETSIQSLFTLIYPCVATLLLIKIRFKDDESRNKISYILITLMWIGFMGLAGYQLLYSNSGGSVSLQDVAFLTWLSVFVVAYCTFFKNTQSGFISIFVHHLMVRWNVTVNSKDFLLLIYAGLLMCLWIVLSSLLFNFIN